MSTAGLKPPTIRKPNKPHYLIQKRRGVNRYVKGYYLCKCGKSFTGSNQFESHRADGNRSEKDAK
jgi:hypothetical protein